MEAWEARRQRLELRRKGLRSQELPAARSCPQAGRKALRPARGAQAHPSARGAGKRVTARE